MNRRVRILGIDVNAFTYRSFLELVKNAVFENKKVSVGYANALTLTLCSRDEGSRTALGSMDFIHPDGAGVFSASRFLYGSDSLPERITGSDFYPMLVRQCIEHGHSVYFFGHRKRNLELIQGNYPELSIAGVHEGYDFEDEEVIRRINRSRAQILLVGLSFPLQEKWIAAHKEALNCNLILAVGDGIRVFSGEKSRGPVFMRKAGLEWLARIAAEPSVYFRRYASGIPEFAFKVLRQKLLSR
ncbi:MAG: WecB/TagA/CpsF family glycosyltransferase [Ignavibacteria bacterium]|nr:WecB/TagA/CpsF family glycosyltransferase [Ignavibacteria bacterium]